MGGGPAPDFGRRDQVNLGEEDFNSLAPSARHPRESADLTLDMLQGKVNMAPNSHAQLPGAANMPRN